VGIVFILTGCVKNKEDINQPIENEWELEKLEAEEQEEKGYEAYFKLREVNRKPVLSKYLTEEYLVDFDHNPSVVKSVYTTEEGIYYEGRKRKQVIFEDRESSKQVPLCNKPNCTHEYIDAKEQECNSYVGTLIGMYDGVLYAIDNEELDMMISENYAPIHHILYRVALDGSGREALTKVFTSYVIKDGNSGRNSSGYVQSIIHRGYYYAFISMQERNSSIMEITRWNLSGKLEEEVLLSERMKGINTRFSYIKAYGPYIYFVEDSILSEDYQERESVIKRMHIDTGIIETVPVEGNVLDYFFVDGYMYYYLWSGEGIYKEDMNTGESTLIIKDPDYTYNRYSDSMYIDETYIYYHNTTYRVIDPELPFSPEVRVYDKSGNLVDIIKIDIEDVKGEKSVNGKVLGLDGDKLIVVFQGEVTKSDGTAGFFRGYYDFDTSNIGTNNHEWKPMLVEDSD